jgi:hypothetical protein
MNGPRQHQFQIRRFRNACTWAPLFILTTLGLPSLTTLAQDASTERATPGKVSVAAQESRSAVYRRVFVPADNFDIWPTNRDKLIPIEASEFKKWIQAANLSDSNSPPSLTIEEAEYSARLEGDRLVEGRGRWQIRMHASSPAFLPLTGVSLVMRDAHWLNDPKRAVLLGLWGGSGEAAATFGLQANKSGTLVYSWDLQLTSSQGGNEAPWRLPPANTTRLILDLPAGKEPHIDGGTVLKASRLSGTERERWQWEIICNESLGERLQIVDAGNQIATPEWQVALHDDVQYDISHRGLDVRAKWKLTLTGGDAPRELAMFIPTGVQIVSATAGNRLLNWRAGNSPNSESARILLRLPTFADDRTVDIDLHAFQPLQLERPWRLPVLRAEAITWNSGTVRLAVLDPLELRGIEPSGCVETKVRNVVDESDRPEVWQFAAYSPDAQLQVNVGTVRPQAVMRMASTIAVADLDVVAHVTSELDVRRGKVHQLSGIITPGWIVETIETVPEQALSDWFIGRENGRSNVNIQFAESASAASKIAVIVTAKLPRSRFSDRLLAATLRMVKWQGMRVDEHTLEFARTDPLTAEPFGAMPVHARTSDKYEGGLSRGEEAASNTQFDLLRAADDSGLILSQQRGNFAADVLLDATVVDQELRRRYRISLTPLSGRIDRVLVRTSAKLEGVQWSESTSGATLSAERLSADDARVPGLPDGSELWLIRLASPTAEPVEITAVDSESMPRSADLPLIAFPYATEQSGRVQLRSELISFFPDVDNMSSVTLPAEKTLNEPADNTTDSLPVRAAYQYNPSDCLDTPRLPRIHIARSPPSAIQTIVVQRVELESYFALGGEAGHRAAYSIASDGAGRFEFDLPSHTLLRGISVNGKEMGQAAIRSASRKARFAISVPSGISTVVVRFDTRQDPLAIGSKLNPPLVETASLLVGGEWILRLPAEYSIARHDSVGWRQRLFGPVGRPDGMRPFQLFRASDWSNLFSTITGQHTAIESATEPLAGWRTYRESFVAAGPAPLYVSHGNMVGTWSLSLFLVCVVAGALFRQLRLSWYIAMLAMLCAAAFLLPTFLTPLAAGAILGFLASFLVPKSRPQVELGASTHWHRLSTIGVSIVLILLAFSSFAFAQTNLSSVESEQTSSDGVVHKVFIPVNAEGKVAGTKYYVAEQFAKELLRAADKNSYQRHWLLRGLSCSGELIERNEDASVVPGGWQIHCDIEVFVRDATVVLPLIEEQATWRRTAMLDGVPTKLEWHNGGRDCTVRVSEPGRYMLVITAVPKSHIKQSRRHVQLTLPALPGASLHIRYPGKVVELTVPNSFAAQVASTAGRFEGELDGSGIVALSWPNSDSVATEALSGRTSQLEWLQFTNEGAQLVTRHVFEGGTRAADEAIIAFDPIWELIPEGDKSPPGQLRKESAHLTTLHIKLPKDDLNRHVLTLRWRLSNDRPWGQLKLPPIELVSHSVSQCWRAISAPSSVDCDLLNASAASGTPAEFLALWGDAAKSNSPQLLMSNVQPADPWALAIRPRQTESEIAETLHVAADDAGLNVVYHAVIRPGTAHYYQFPLAITKDLNIDRIELTASDETIPLRWVRTSSDQVNVFFSKKLTGDYQLNLQAKLRTHNSDELSLPNVHSSGRSSSKTFHVYRNENKLVQVVGLSEDEDRLDAPLESPPTDWTARHIAGFRLDEQTAANVRLKVVANDLRLAGDSLTALSETTTGWLASYFCEFTVAQGTLGELQLQVSPAANGPPSLESNLPASIAMEGQGSEMDTIHVRFSEPMPTGSSAKLRVDVPVTFAAMPIAVPGVKMEPGVEGKRYIRVQTSLNGQPIDWNELGVRKSELPPDLQSAAVAPASQFFEVIKDPHLLTLRPGAAASNSARIPLADTFISTDELARYLITTRFVVESDGPTSCTLQLPADQELVTVRISGRSALVAKVNGKQWRVPLGSPNLPIMLEVISRCEESTARNTYERPRLLIDEKPLPVEIGLWSLGYPAGTVRPVIERMPAVSADDQAVLRFDRMLSIAESATPAAKDSPLQDGYNWFRPWASRLTKLRAETAEALNATANRQVASQVSPAVEDQFAQTAARLDAWLDSCAEQLSLSNGQRESIDTAESEVGSFSEVIPSSEWTYSVTDGVLNHLQLQSPAVATSARQSHWIGLLAVACIGITGIYIARRQELWHWVYQWPNAVLFLVGLAYWAWLRPSWLGLVIAAASVVLAFRSGWPGRSIRLDASTVLRANRPK